MHNTLPVSFKNYFITNKDGHDHSSRFNDDIHILQCNTNVRAFWIKIYGTKISWIWNIAPYNLMITTL